MTIDADIDRRSGWPAELCVLLEQFPRADWLQHMTPLARFWIDRHNDFRRLCDSLQSSYSAYLEKPGETEALAGELSSRSHFLLSMLHGHHQVEDFHYFPAFRAADPRLGPGFDVLARDHELLHENGVSVVESLTALRQTVTGGGSTAADINRRAADRSIQTGQDLCRRILRHLDDEEDLVIPLMLAHR